MIRIFTTNEPRALKLTVDGQLTADYVAAVETSIDQAIGQQRPVHLFLRDVSDIDELGRTLLSRVAAKGVALSASGVYSSYVVAEILKQPASTINSTRPAMMPGSGTWPLQAMEHSASAETKPNNSKD